MRWCMLFSPSLSAYAPRHFSRGAVPQMYMKSIALMLSSINDSECVIQVFALIDIMERYPGESVLR